jgi:signal transduction histidine kinase
MPLAPSSVNLKLLCREVIDELTAANPNRVIYFSSPVEVICRCDGARMRQVVANLVGNALEHGASNSDVQLSLATVGSDISLAVHNQGTPIAPELLPTIFDPLVRETSTDRQRRTGSVGLGLYIAREIVTAHGGGIDVRSSADSGTVFTVRFPCRINTFDLGSGEGEAITGDGKPLAGAD